MKLFIALLCIIPIITSTCAQNVDWLINGGGIKSDKGTTIVTDGNGNTFITGYYNEEAFFGPLQAYFSYDKSKETFIVKIDSDGNYIWETHATNYYDDRGLGLTIDQAGNTYVTGTCWGGLDWPPLNEYAPSGFTDQIFVTKVDNSGMPIWMKNAGNDDTSIGSGINENGLPQTLYQDDHGQDLVTDSQGNIYVTGFLSNIAPGPYDAYFDNITIPLNPYDSIAFLAKLSNDGTWQWVETFGGIYQHRDIGISIDDEDMVYVTGGFNETQTFGTTTLTANGETDIYVAKYDSNGNFIWVAQAGSNLADRGNGLTYGHDGHMYVTGEFRDIATFGNYTVDNAGGPNGRDVFVAKLSKSGEWKWVSRAGSKKGKDRGNSITANTQGNVFITGQFSSAADFGNLEIDSNGDSVQVFVAAIDTNGVWRWVVHGGGNGFDRGQGITSDENCNVWAIGYFENSMSISGAGVSTQTTGSKDIFTLKISDACFGYDPEDYPEPVLDEYCEVEVANIFTPNGDNINEVLTLTNACNTDFHAVIVNRWGTKVFESNDPTDVWDGTNEQGTLVAEGVYFYKVVVTYTEKPDETYSGFVNVAY